MAVGLVITQKGFDRVGLMLSKATKDIKDFSEPLEEAGRAVKEHAETKVFSSRGAEINKPWKPLKPMYAKYKARKRGSADPLLVWDGSMKDSFFNVATQYQGIIGNTDWKFAFHQDKNRALDNSPRSMLKFVDKNTKMVTDAFRKWLQRIFNK